MTNSLFIVIVLLVLILICVLIYSKKKEGFSNNEQFKFKPCDIYFTDSLASSEKEKQELREACNSGEFSHGDTYYDAKILQDPVNTRLYSNRKTIKEKLPVFNSSDPVCKISNPNWNQYWTEVEPPDISSTYDNDQRGKPGTWAFCAAESPDQNYVNIVNKEQNSTVSIDLPNSYSLNSTGKNYNRATINSVTLPGVSSFYCNNPVIAKQSSQPFQDGVALTLNSNLIATKIVYYINGQTYTSPDQLDTAKLLHLFEALFIDNLTQDNAYQYYFRQPTTKSLPVVIINRDICGKIIRDSSKNLTVTLGINLINSPNVKTIPIVGDSLTNNLSPQYYLYGTYDNLVTNAGIVANLINTNMQTINNLKSSINSSLNVINSLVDVDLPRQYNAIVSLFKSLTGAIETVNNFVTNASQQLKDTLASGSIMYSDFDNKLVQNDGMAQMILNNDSTLSLQYNYKGTFVPYITLGTSGTNGPYSLTVTNTGIITTYDVDGNQWWTIGNTIPSTDCSLVIYGTELMVIASGNPAPVWSSGTEIPNPPDIQSVVSDSNGEGSGWYQFICQDPTTGLRSPPAATQQISSVNKTTYPVLTITGNICTNQPGRVTDPTLIVQYSPTQNGTFNDAQATITEKFQNREEFTNRMFPNERFTNRMFPKTKNRYKLAEQLGKFITFPNFSKIMEPFISDNVTFSGKISCSSLFSVTVDPDCSSAAVNISGYDQNSVVKSVRIDPKTCDHLVYTGTNSLPWMSVTDFYCSLRNLEDINEPGQGLTDWLSKQTLSQLDFKDGLKNSEYFAFLTFLGNAGINIDSCTIDSTSFNSPNANQLSLLNANNNTFSYNSFSAVGLPKIITPTSRPGYNKTNGEPIDALFNQFIVAMPNGIPISKRHYYAQDDNCDPIDSGNDGVGSGTLGLTRPTPPAPPPPAPGYIGVVPTAGQPVFVLGNPGMSPWTNMNSFWNQFTQQAGSKWVWYTANAQNGAPTNATKTFSKGYFNTTGKLMYVSAFIAVDNIANLYVNGSKIGSTVNGWELHQFDFTLIPKYNLIEIQATNLDGPAGLLFIMYSADQSILAVSDSSWLFYNGLSSYSNSVKTNFTQSKGNALTGNSVATISPVNSDSECAVACNNMGVANCRGYNYNSSAKTCDFYSNGQYINGLAAQQLINTPPPMSGNSDVTANYITSRNYSKPSYSGPCDGNDILYFNNNGRPGSEALCNEYCDEIPGCVGYAAVPDFSTCYFKYAIQSAGNGNAILCYQTD